MQSPAQGTIKVSTATRIGHSATPQRIQEFYTAGLGGVLETWLYVVMGQNQAYKNDTIIGDPSTAKRINEDYWNSTQQNFSIYIVMPAKTSILGGDIADNVKGYLKPILKALANYIFESDLSDEKMQPCQYVGDEADDYITATYTHRFDFVVQGFIQVSDTTDYNSGVPLQRVDGVFAEGLDYDLNTR
jgi:hypothetical protein